ncbi:MAG: TIM barrel protein [Methylococcales bacterium]
MLQFSANLSMLFTELDFIDRFKAAKESGFDTVEIQFPYSLPAEQIKQALEQNQLKLALFNVDADDLLQGGEGLAAVPEKQQRFKFALQQSIAYAEILQPEAINILPGRCINNPARKAEYLETFINNLSLAADTFSNLGIKTVFEAINTDDMPGFIIHTGSQMLDIIEQISHPMLYLQYDIYHMHKMNENISRFINKYADKIGHIQFADNPGRGQPGSGAIDFDTLFIDIQQSQYSSWVGAEYKPTFETSKSLTWLSRYQSLQ